MHASFEGLRTPSCACARRCRGPPGWGGAHLGMPPRPGAHSPGARGGSRAGAPGHAAAGRGPPRSHRPWCPAGWQGRVVLGSVDSSNHFDHVLCVSVDESTMGERVGRQPDGELKGRGMALQLTHVDDQQRGLYPRHRLVVGEDVGPGGPARPARVQHPHACRGRAAEASLGAKP